MTKRLSWYLTEQSRSFPSVLFYSRRSDHMTKMCWHSIKTGAHTAAGKIADSDLIRDVKLKLLVSSMNRKLHNADIIHTGHVHLLTVFADKIDVKMNGTLICFTWTRQHAAGLFWVQMRVPSINLLLLTTRPAKQKYRAPPNTSSNIYTCMCITFGSYRTAPTLICCIGWVARGLKYRVVLQQFELSRIVSM